MKESTGEDGAGSAGSDVGHPDSLSSKASRAVPRLRMHAEGARRQLEWPALFDRTGKTPCGVLRHRWRYYGFGSTRKVCEKCATVREVFLL